MTLQNLLKIGRLKPHAPTAEEIRRLLDPIVNEGYDLVQGSRYLPGGSFGNMPAHRQIATRYIHPLLLSLAVGFNFNAFFLYILSAPVFLSTHLGLGPSEYSWLFIPSIAGILLGSQLSGRAAGKLTRAQTLRRAYGFMGAAVAANLAYSLVFPPALPWSVLPIFSTILRRAPMSFSGASQPSNSVFAGALPSAYQP
jgi:hypothetical protein